MMKTMTVCLLACLTSFAVFAQQGNNQIGAGLELGLPLGDFGEGSEMGIGGSLKGLYGIGQAGQVGLTLGYISFGMKESTSSASGSSGIIPIMATYRHHFNGFYLEPQAGLSLHKAKVNIDGMGSVSSSSSAFGYAIGAGYLIGDVDISARYQGASKDGGSMSFIGIRLGYNFSF